MFETRQCLQQHHQDGHPSQDEEADTVHQAPLNHSAAAVRHQTEIIPGSPHKKHQFKWVPTECSAIDGRPTPINNEEAILPRHQRTVLSQLRSGHCQLINNYKKRTKRAESSSSNECSADLQDVACPAHPANLTPSSLWSRPTEAIRELGYLFPPERD